MVKIVPIQEKIKIDSKIITDKDINLIQNGITHTLNKKIKEVN